MFLFNHDTDNEKLYQKKAVPRVRSIHIHSSKLFRKKLSPMNIEKAKSEAKKRQQEEIVFQAPEVDVDALKHKQRYAIKHLNTRPINAINLETGLEYSFKSSKEALSALSKYGVYRSGIANVLAGRANSCYGFTFKYAENP